jgi:hypothetical protein
MPINWTRKVEDAITNLATKTNRVLSPARALAVIDDVLAGNLDAAELAAIRGVPQAWIGTTFGHVTRVLAAAGRLPEEAVVNSRAATSLTKWRLVLRQPGKKPGACLDRTILAIFPSPPRKMPRTTAQTDGMMQPMEQPDEHMQAREAEKLADLESLADALAAFRQLHRDLDQWERVHLALGLAGVVSECYGIGELEAALALTPEIERSPSVKLPSDPVYQQFDWRCSSAR